LSFGAGTFGGGQFGGTASTAQVRADSTVPAAVTALGAIWAAALPDVQIFAYELTDDVQDDYVAVAYPDAGDPTGNPGVSGVQDWASLGAGSKSEEYDIRCELSSWAGDGTPADRVARAFAMFAVLQDALRADPGLQGSLGGSGWAKTGSFSVLAGDPEKGPVCTMPFAVEVRNVRI
jgi:hypothetical protein